MKKSKLFYTIAICLSFVSIFLLFRTITTSLIGYYTYQKYFLGYGIIAVIVAAVHLAALIFCTVKAFLDVKRNDRISKLTVIILLITVISLAFWMIAVKYNEIFVYIIDVDELIENIKISDITISGQIELLNTSKWFSVVNYAFDVVLAAVNIIFTALSLTYLIKNEHIDS